MPRSSVIAAALAATLLLVTPAVLVPCSVTHIPWVAWVGTALAAPRTADHFRVEELASGVYAVVSTDPLGLANHSNAVFIVGDVDVIVVDTQFTLARTRAVLAALRQITDKPVRSLINTHWHDDHTFGNQVYREAFPDAEIIAHENTKTDMETTGVENRAGQVGGGPSALAMFRAAIDSKTAIDDTPMSEEERLAYESTITIAQEYLDEQKDFHLTLPTRTFGDHLTVRQGSRVIEIRHYGSAVTRGDAVVYLPAEDVLIAGDVVDNPVPFAYGCDVSGWIEALDSLIALEPRTIVPGHGDVMNTPQQMRVLRLYLSELRAESLGAATIGKTASDVCAGGKAKDIRDRLAGRNKMLAFLCDNYFIAPVVKSSFQSLE